MTRIMNRIVATVLVVSCFVRVAAAADEPSAPSGPPPPLTPVRPVPEEGPRTDMPAPAPAERTEPPPPREPENPDGTPRHGVLSGYFIGIEGGVASLKSSANDRAAIGPGGAVALSLGMALWDQLPLGFSFGGVFMEDKTPFSEFVVDCTTVGGTPVGCGDPQSQKSTINGSFLSFETGYQRRFRPMPTVSLLPAALVGYLAAPGGLSRGVGCDGCKSIPVDGVSPGGVYLAPSFKITFGRTGFFAVALRSELFLTGDLLHRTLLGLEIGAP